MIFDTVVKLLCEQFGIDKKDITEETSLEDLGADSVDIVELSMAMEEEFGIDEMSEDDLAGIHTVGDLVNYITNAREE